MIQIPFFFWVPKKKVENKILSFEEPCIYLLKCIWVIIISMSTFEFNILIERAFYMGEFLTSVLIFDKKHWR